MLKFSIVSLLILFGTHALAQSDSCNAKLTQAALAHMKQVDSTGHFLVASGPYFFNPNLADFTIDDHSAFGYYEYDVQIQTDSACHVLDVSAVETLGPDEH